MTRTIYSEGSFHEETWTEVAPDADLPETCDLVLPLVRFLENPGVAGDGRKVAVRIAAGDEVEALEPHLDDLALVLVEFPSFADGRGFSAARILREEFGFSGDIRAVGNYILDQMPLARRCGVSSFEVSRPEVLKGLRNGDWPEVTRYLQPVGTVDEIPAGTRPWARLSRREVVEAAE